MPIRNNLDAATSLVGMLDQHIGQIAYTSNPNVACCCFVVRRISIAPDRSLAFSWMGLTTAAASWCNRTVVVCWPFTLARLAVVRRTTAFLTTTEISDTAAAAATLFLDLEARSDFISCVEKK